jgi:hypothetical protein
MDSVGAPVVQEQHHHVKCSNAMNSCPGNSCQCKWWTVTAAANGSGAVLLELSMQVLDGALAATHASISAGQQPMLPVDCCRSCRCKWCGFAAAEQASIFIGICPADTKATVQVQH